MKHYQAVIIGGGSAGLAAAVSLKDSGVDQICIFEKDCEAGGILEQCIHNGFGLQTFHEQLSGPAYAERYLEMACERNVEIRLNTMVTRLTEDRHVFFVSDAEGYGEVSADAVILCVGCYERARGAVMIAGSRPSGIMTAGQAQRWLNIDGYLPGRNVWILGSGDIGLIMARRMTLEGAKVLGVAEIMPYSSGLPRNIRQCLEDFHIPLYLSHTVTRVFGRERLERIEVMQVDENRNPVAGTERYYDVDTLLLSTGLIPENSLAEHAGIRLDPSTRGPYVDECYMTEKEGIFACGNGLHVHDLVDFVSLQASRAGTGAARYIRGSYPHGVQYEARASEGIGYVVPQRFHGSGENTEFFFRVKKPVENAELTVCCNGRIIRSLRRKHLMPSEMERMMIRREELQGNLEFSVKECENG